MQKSLLSNKIKGYMRKQDETMKVIYYSWEESIQDLHELVRQMSIDRFRPQVIVGISRGGLPPAVMLSAYYDIPLKPLKASLRHFPLEVSTGYRDC